MSADPLEVHTPTQSREPNVYAYVSGKALQAIDPFGLAGEEPARPCGGVCEAAAANALKLMESRSLSTQFFRPAPTNFGTLRENFAGEGLYYRGQISMKASSWRSLGPKVRGGMGSLTTFVHEVTHRSLPSKASDTFKAKAIGQLGSAHSDLIKHSRTTASLLHETVAYQVEHWVQTYMEFSEKVKTPGRYGGLYELSKQYEARMDVEVRAMSYQTYDAEGKPGAKLVGRVGLTGELRKQLLGEVFPGVSGGGGTGLLADADGPEDGSAC